ncbi:MAG: T9SS type A sorting domain-containing protein [Bacteroidota bacterium]|nr:T9SS type A sorting domain-containing protein [Bacteroidota bacterium]
MKNLFFIHACFILSYVNSQTLLNEPFFYGTTSGPLCGTGGVTANWTPHSSAGVTPVLYIISNLTYPGYGPGSSIGNGATTFANGALPRENVNRIIPLVNTGSVYVSFLLKVSGATSTTVSSDYVVHFSDTFGSTFSGNANGRIFIKNQMLLPACSLGLSKGSLAGAAVYSPTQYSISQTLLVVMKYKFNTGSSNDDSVYAWIYTSGVPQTEPPPHLIASDMTVNDLAQIRSICIRQGTVGTSYGTIDAIKVGLTWPSTLLPVEWLDFNAQQINKNEIRLNWSTASEKNNAFFEIERSADVESLSSNSEWKKVGTVKGNGNSNSIINYQFTDNIEELNKSKLLYRIRQVDFDGNLNYSKIISLDFNKTITVNPVVYPNPFNNKIMINTHEPLFVKVMDIRGNIIVKQELLPSEALATEHVHSGIYFIEITGNSGTEYYKMIKL